MRRPAALSFRHIHPRRRALLLERLEDRLALAGFGPEDGAFIMESWPGMFTDVQIQAGDQKIVAAGGLAGQAGVVVARYDAQGNADAGYGSGGLANPPSLTMGAGTLVLQPDGKAVVAGQTTLRTLGVARLNADGSADDTFGVGGLGSFNIPATSSEAAYGVELLSNGKIAVAGFASGGPAVISAFVAGFTAGGVVDTASNNGFGPPDPVAPPNRQGYNLVQFPVKFGSSVKSQFSTFDDMAVQPDNKVVAAGTFLGRDAANNLVDTLVVARYTAAGSGPGGILDTSFNNGHGYSTLVLAGINTRAVALQADGKIVVLGEFPGINGSGDMLVVRFTASGALDTSFGGGSGYVGFDIDGSATTTTEVGYDVAVQPDGRIVAVGTVSPTGSVNDRSQLVVRLNPNGTLDGTFGTLGVKLATPPDGYRAIDGRSAALAADGTIIVAGGLLTPDSDPDPDIDIHIYQPFVMRFLGGPPAETKFYIVDDAAANVTYEYAGQGASVENYALASTNSAPRGAASTAAGDKVWVVDANRNVYVYSPSGGLLGSWTAGTIASNAVVEGIATDGTDVWIVDAKSGKVFRYAGAASRVSGSQTAASSFNLNSGNKDPKDVVTDGSSLWVVNDSSANKVFKYTVGGALLGSWTIDAANSTPTGITIDPSNVSDIWIVDSGTDRVYQYVAAASRTSGSQAANAIFALAEGNTNPQGLADPPTPDGENESAEFREVSRAYVYGDNWGWIDDAEPKVDAKFTPSKFKYEPARCDNLIVTRHKLGSGFEVGKLDKTLPAGMCQSDHIASTDEIFALCGDDSALPDLRASTRPDLQRHK